MHQSPNQYNQKFSKTQIISISISDSKWSEWKEKHLKSKSKNCEPRRKTSDIERTFQESAWKPSSNQKEITNGLLDIKLEQLMEEELDAGLKKLKAEKLLASIK